MARSESDALLARAAALEAEAARLRGQARRWAGPPEAPSPHPDRRDGAAREDRMRAIFDSPTRFAIVATDLDGRVTDWNAGAERVLGWPADAIRGHGIARLFTPEDREAGRPEAEMREARERGRADDERWHMRADGSRLWAAGEMVPLRDADGRPAGYVKVLSDRTEEHRRGDALHLVEDRLRRAQEAGGVGVFTVGIDDDVVYPTPEFCRLYGLPERPSYPATAFETLVVPEDAHLVSTAESRRRAVPPRDVEYRICRPDTGELRWIARRGEFERDAAGRPVRFSGVARDVTERRAAGDALALSEARYRALFDTIDDGFCVIEFFDGPHGPLSDYVHVEANPGYERHTGIPDIVGRTLRDIAPAEAEGWLDLYGGVLRTGTPIRFERAFPAAQRHIEVSAVRIEPASRRQVSVLFRDVTARKRAEADLLASEAQFRAFAGAVPNQVWAARPDGALYWFNAQVYAYAGAEPGSLDGSAAWGTLIHADDLPSAADAWSRSLATGSDYEVEFRIRRADGAYRWFLARAVPVRDGAGTVTGWVGTNTDIDERRRHAAELERLVAARTAERDMIWRATSDLLCVASFGGRFVSLNPAWSATLGWSEDEMKARPFLDFVHPDDRPATEAAAAGLTRGEAQLAFENRYRHRDGGYRWLSWNAVPSEGLIYATVRDVSAAKAQAEALARTEEALRQAQKMEAVGQLTGGLAHDFNNMLAGIVGSLELMQTRMLQGRMGDLERYIGAAQGAAKRAAALTHRLLAFSRRQTLTPKPTDVNRLVEGMMELVRRTVGPAVSVEVVGAGGLWPTLVDPSQLENALLNLCINARDAMPAGGRIVVETGNRWLDHRGARDRDLEPGQYVSLCVSDNGTGMAPDVIAKAFDPFFTTKPIGEGTGLGLSMIYGFAKQSGGQVRIYSELGAGTMVCLYLPRHLGEAEAAEAASELSEMARARVGETVLVVDDEPTVRMLVTEVLEDLGYAAIEAADGASGLKVLQSDVRVDLLITDVGLPGGMNGRQMADAALVGRPDLKVLFITGYAENAALNHGHLAHGMQVMTKPFGLEALAARIRGIIEGDA